MPNSFKSSSCVPEALNKSKIQVKGSKLLLKRIALSLSFCAKTISSLIEKRLFSTIFLNFSKRIFTSSFSWVLNKTFFRSKAYKDIATHGAEMSDIFSKDSYFEINSKKIPVDNFANALEEVLLISERSFTKSRYKGLGEMNADQLWGTTMNPDMRILGQVTIEDALAADELFHALMGDEVEPRKEFIDENAKLVVNLDV